MTDDGDCDGIVSAQDCDDNDAESTIVETDADCDGILTDEDCDDNDSINIQLCRTFSLSNGTEIKFAHISGSDLVRPIRALYPIELFFNNDDRGDTRHIY